MLSFLVHTVERIKESTHTTTDPTHNVPQADKSVQTQSLTTLHTSITALTAHIQSIYDFAEKCLVERQAHRDARIIKVKELRVLIDQEYNASELIKTHKQLL